MSINCIAIVAIDVIAIVVRTFLCFLFIIRIVSSCTCGCKSLIDNEIYIILKSGSILLAIFNISAITISVLALSSKVIFIFCVIKEIERLATPLTFLAASSIRFAQFAQSTSILNVLFIML